MKRWIVGFVLVALTVAGCSLGGSVAGWRPSGQAAGSEIDLDLGSLRRVKGELITLDSGGFLVLQPERLVRVDPAAVKGGSAYRTSFDSPLSHGDRERLRLMSRYPQGVSAGLEQSLLESYGFTSIEIETTPSQP